VLTDAFGQTGVYCDEGGHPMLGSALVRDPKFTATAEVQISSSPPSRGSALVK
jgi:hypothetical protein